MFSVHSGMLLTDDQYTYYTLSALGFKVPRRLKKTLTTMQIGQFLVGFTFAAGHLFVEYTIPSHISYAGRYGIKQAASAVSAAAANIATAASDPAVTAGAAAWLKKLAFRAAGEEGLAENVRNQYGEVFGPEADHVQSTLEEMKRNTAYEAINCIDTTGQSFAIWLNLIYLAPLTWLFLRFFFRSYSRRTSVSAQHPTHRGKLSKSAEDAAHGVEREVDSLGRSAEDGLSELAKKAKKKSADNRRISETIERFENGLSKGYDQAIAQGKQLSEETVKGVESVKEKVGKWGDASPSKEESSGTATPQKAKDGAQSLVESATETVKKGTEAAKDQVQQGAQAVKEGTQQVSKKIDEVAEPGEKTAAITDDVSARASEATDAAKDEISRRKDSGKANADESKDVSSKAASKKKKKNKQATQQAQKELEDTAEQAEQKATGTSEEVKKEGESQPPALHAEESGVLVEHDDGVAEASGGDQKPEVEQATEEPQKDDEKTEGDASNLDFKEDTTQGLSSTDSTGPGAKSYADELK